MCAVISINDVLQFTTECLITFFDALNERMVSPKEKGLLMDLPCKEVVPLVHCTAKENIQCEVLSISTVYIVF